MTSWPDAHRRGAALAAQIHADLAVTLDGPIDVFGAIDRLGLVLAFAPLGKVSGLYIPHGKSRGILLHSGHPRTRQRYSAAHELGHHVFGHEIEIDVDLENAFNDVSDRWPAHEMEAEAFAAWFLMPRRLLRFGLRQLGITELTTPFQVYQLSLWLGASYAATARQLGTTRLVTASLAAKWSAIPPRGLKQEISGAAPEDLRNDGWWLESGRDRASVDLRPGDNLVLTLPEIPSSGFAWKLNEVPESLLLINDSFDSDWSPNVNSVGNPHPEVAGNQLSRWLVFRVDENAEPTIQRLSLIKERSWQEGSEIERYELLVAVSPPLRGIQLPSEAFALVG